MKTSIGKRNLKVSFNFFILHIKSEVDRIKCCSRSSKQLVSGPGLEPDLSIGPPQLSLCDAGIQ